jgi:catechol 2,3-dioxygenase-like lactoylglutathione lyase family enzyme
MAKEAYFLLYVKDKAASAAFYSEVLGLEPIVETGSITEFRLLEGAVLGIMSFAAAARNVDEGVPSTAPSSGSPKAELYLVVEDPAGCHRRALERGAREISPMQSRDWGHRAAYSLDPDGHVLAFGEKEEGIGV